MERVNGYYKMYGDTMQALAADMDPIYVSNELEKILTKLVIKAHQAPSEHHDLNGSIDAYIKIISNKVTSYFYQAPYMPHALWTRIWTYSEIVNNMMQSTMPGSDVTRSQEFTVEKPNFKKIPLLTPGRPISYLVYKEICKDAFSSHTRYGITWNPIYSHLDVF